VSGPSPTADPNQTPWPWLRGLLSGLLLGGFYLLIFRALTFIPRFHRFQQGGVILMSFSFLFLGPLCAGFLTVYQTSFMSPLRVAQWIFAPWLPLALNLVVALAAAWEGRICIVFILPIAMIASSLGGVLAGLLHRHLRKRINPTTLTCFAALPLLLAVLETTLHQPIITRTVNTSTPIHATAETVWRNIERVPAIRPAELRPSWATAIGFPRPVEATLSYSGVGGVRNARFERGLTFIETVTDWQPDHTLAFTIRADTARIPPKTLDEHVTIGGQFFDVLDGRYTIEPISPTEVVLHLESRQRLSTDFNGYAALWSDAVMQDMQNNILQVIQHRCQQP
jgi:hypothetical protein